MGNPNIDAVNLFFWPLHRFAPNITDCCITGNMRPKNVDWGVPCPHTFGQTVYLCDDSWCFLKNLHQNIWGISPFTDVLMLNGQNDQIALKSVQKLGHWALWLVGDGDKHLAAGGAGISWPNQTRVSTDFSPYNVDQDAKVTWMSRSVEAGGYAAQGQDGDVSAVSSPVRSMKPLWETQSQQRTRVVVFTLRCVQHPSVKHGAKTNLQLQRDLSLLDSPSPKIACCLSRGGPQ